jgi:serine/threonine protein kinase
MGDVYAALDLKSDPPREVAIKTIRDTSDATAVELFKRECSVLMSFTHPNVIELYETGDFDDRGGTKPFFVMARLRGVTLAELIKDSPQPLTVQRTIDIIQQVCRGLQAAHDKGLVHRDIKPSNIFVLQDDSVKVIDFGVAHLVSSETIGAKGTLYYMAPEQFEGKPVTPATDVFSLGAVCYEALTQRRPFNGSTQDEIRAEIMKGTPPAASTLNPAVNAALSQVIHAAMAKKPLHRFSSAREFGDCLRKALRNEPIDRFDTSKLQLRLSRVEKALEASQYEIADEILGEIEEEGYLHPSVNELRRQIHQALRNRDIRQFLESARRFDAQEEYTLALQKVQDALQLESTNGEALELRALIEAKRSSQQIGNWLSLAQRHLTNLAFEPAREAVSSVLHMLPTDVTALRLMEEINRVEQEVVRKREEKERFFDSAVELHKKGDLTAALSRLEKVLELDREAPDAVHPERGAELQKFYNEVRSDSEAIRNGLETAKRELEAKDYSAADNICDRFLVLYPNHALFQALKFDIGERQRQDLSAYIAEVDRATETEPDLDRRAKVLQEALVRYPDEAHFKRALKGVNAKRDLINGLVNQARNLEDRGQYSEAMDKWGMLRTIYEQYPGLDFEIERLRRRLEQQTRSEAKARWIERIDGALNAGDYNRALELVEQALIESPQDPQLVPLERSARQRVEQSQRAQNQLEEGRRLLEEKSFDEALEKLETAYALDDHNALIRAVYIEAILNKVTTIIDIDLSGSEKLIEKAFGLDPTNARVKNMWVLTLDRKRTIEVDQYLSNARELEAANEVERALAEVEKALAAYAGESRLVQLHSHLKGSIKQLELRRDRDKLRELVFTINASNDDSPIQSMFDESVVLAGKHPADEQIQALWTEIDKDVRRRSAVSGHHAVEEPKPAPVVAPEITEQVTPRKPAADVPAEEPIRRDRPTSRIGMVIAAAAVVVLIVGFLAWRFTPAEVKPPEPPVVAVPVTPVGTAETRVSVSLRKDPADSAAALATLGPGQAVELLNQVPALGLEAWTFVRSQGDTSVQGYLHLGDLQNIRTSDHQFDVGHAVALMAGSNDPTDLEARLTRLDQDLAANPLPASATADDVAIQMSEGYVRLAQVTEAAAAKPKLDAAEKYLTQVQNTPEATERITKQKELIDSARKAINPVAPPTLTPISDVLAQAKSAYDRGQYVRAIDLCNKVLSRERNNAQAAALLKQATDAKNKALVDALK